jgi:DNA polymerase
VEILTIDFETFFAKGYSLSAKTMTTELYVRDPQFEVIGVAVKHGRGETQWCSGDMTEVWSWLRRFDWAGSAALMHNAHFDGFILNHHFGIRPGFILDTLSMSRPMHGTQVGGSLKVLAQHYGLGAKGDDTTWAYGMRRADFSSEQLAQYGRYCCNDVDLTRALFDRLLPQTPQSELRLIDETIRLFTEPRLRLDTTLLESHLETVRAEKEALLERVGGADVRGVLASNPQFAALLEQHGVVPPTKTSPRTGKETYAFAKSDQGLKDLLEHEDPNVQALVAARMGVKSTIEETRTERFIGVGQRGLLPIPLKYWGAETTGRWSGMDLANFQNLPRGGAIRKSVQALPGQALVACDSSNIELRVNHTLAGQTESVQAFREQRDLYCEFASILYGREITKADKHERQFGKLAHLGLGYGMGHAKFRDVCRQQGITIDETEARRTVSLWRETYDQIPSLWRSTDAAIDAILKGYETTFGSHGVVKAGRIDEETLGLKFPGGRYVRYPHLSLTEDGYRYAGRRNEQRYLFGGKVVENAVQALARHILADQWLWVAAWCKKHAPAWRVVLQVHDELVLAGPEGDAQRVAEAVGALMSRSPTWWPHVPLAAEWSIAARYGDAK